MTAQHLSMRAAWQQVADRHQAHHDRSPSSWCDYCNQPWPCPDRVTALAQINALNEARHTYRCRPGCADCDLRDKPWRSNDVRCAVTPDPETT